MASQVYSGEETCRGGLQQMLEPTATYRLGAFIEKEGPGRGW
jgi:hypothetical protein